MEQPIFQVSQLISVVNQTLEYAYPSVIVEGEVASFKVSKGKFVFFDIKDDAGAINCFLMAYQLRHPLEDGMRVRLLAQPRLTAWGKFSLTVREILPMGEGSIKRAFQLLHAKLQKEGLFDAERKRALPAIPARVALIASVESAGYADFIKIVTQRWGGVEIIVADVQVQGLSAAEQIIRALDYFNQQLELPEVIVLARGGGSADDLAVFNDETLVRTIAASRVPTLVGVGHEVDTTLADLAADVRAATPSNAAQLLVPDRSAMLAEIVQRESRLLERLTSRVTALRKVVDVSGTQMLTKLQALLIQQQRRVLHARQLLKQLDPKIVLQRGYALVRMANGTLVKDAANDVKIGDQLTVSSSRAIITAGVLHVDRKK